MKRVYRVTIVIERTFSRKATREAKLAATMVSAFVRHSAQGWTVESTRITNRAKSEAKPAKPPESSPAVVYEDIAENQALAELREIASDMAALLGNVKRPRVEFAPGPLCDGKFSHNVAHAHNRSARWFSGPRAGRRIPKGLICIRRGTRGIGRSDRERWPRLMAHELMHVRMPGGSHNRAAFKAGVDALLARYYESKGLPRDMEKRLEEFKECPVCRSARIEAGVIGA